MDIPQREAPANRKGIQSDPCRERGGRRWTWEEKMSHLETGKNVLCGDGTWENSFNHLFTQQIFTEYLLCLDTGVKWWCMAALRSLQLKRYVRHHPWKFLNTSINLSTINKKYKQIPEGLTGGPCLDWRRGPESLLCRRGHLAWDSMS